MNTGIPIDDQLTPFQMSCQFWVEILTTNYWVGSRSQGGLQNSISHLHEQSLSLFPMFPLIWSNSHLNSDNPYSRRSRPSEHARRWEQKSRPSKQCIFVKMQKVEKEMHCYGMAQIFCERWHTVLFCSVFVFFGWLIRAQNYFQLNVNPNKFYQAWSATI